MNSHEEFAAMLSRGEEGQLEALQHVKQFFAEHRDELTPANPHTNTFLGRVVTVSVSQANRVEPVVVAAATQWLSEPGVLSAMFRHLFDGSYVPLRVFFDLSSESNLIPAMCNENLVYEVVGVLHKTERPSWPIVATLWNICCEPRGSVQVMVSGGIPSLLRLLSHQEDVIHQACGACAALSYTDVVRDLATQYFERNPEGLATLVKVLEGKGCGEGTKFMAATAICLQLLNPTNRTILRELGAIHAVAQFMDDVPVDFALAGFELGETDLLGYEQLILSNVKEVHRFLAFSLARFSVNNLAVNVCAREMVAAMKRRSHAHVFLLSLSHDAKTRKHALQAADNLALLDDTEGARGVEAWLEHVGCVDAKKVGKALSGANIDLPLLADLNTSMDDIRHVVLGLSSKGAMQPGDALRVLTATAALRKNVEACAEEVRESARRYGSSAAGEVQMASHTVGDAGMAQREGGGDGEAGKPSVFLSYCWKNKPAARRVRKELEGKGLGVWMDEGTMKGGDELFAKIDQGITDARVVVCCVSAEYAMSTNCNREVCLAEARHKLLVPVVVGRIGDWPPPGAMGVVLANKLYIDISNEETFHANVEGLLKTVLASV